MAVDLARDVKALGVERIVYTDVARDGMLTGVNVEETEKVARESGSSRRQRRRRLGRMSGALARRDTGIEGVILGRALYDGKIDFRSLRARMTSWQ